MSLFENASLVITPNGTKASKLYSIKPTDGSGDLSVTRATTATRVNSSGLIESVSANVPRLDYSNGSCPSILVEPQRTNILLNSKSFAGSFGYNQCSITSNQTAPDGSNNAKRITNGTTTTDVFFEQFVSFTPNTYTWSIFVKKGTDTVATIKPVHVGIAGDVSLMTFNFATETITSAGGIISSGFKKYANGWYRIFCSVVITSSVVSLRGRFGNSNTPNVYNDWAFPQLEAGSYATSYIPTTSASVTRNADVISKTGISSLIGQTEGTIFCDVNLNLLNNSGTLLSLSNGSYNSFIILVINNSNRIQLFWRTNGGTINSFETPNAVSNAKIAVAYQSGNIVFYVNGILINTGVVNVNWSFPLSQLDLGNELGSVTRLQRNNISALWKTRLTNTQLAELTTI